jgi:amino acid transporter
MIAIGGVIGTGLFLGTAGNLQSGGPAGLLISYSIMASLLFAVMTALGEMISEFPLAGGQFALADRFVSPELGFAMGWLFWYNYIVVLPAELSAAAVLVSYWTPAGQVDSTCTSAVCSNALWIGIFLIVVYAINYAGTRVYGEMEFWFCSIKVITIVGLIILGIIISAGGGPNGQAIGFKYWKETGGFMQLNDIPGAKGRFLGFFSVLISAAFAFIGSEITAIAAAEAANPRKAVPTAIKGVWIRLVLFYLCSAFLIGILVSPTDPSLNLKSTAAKSPFVIAIKNAGIPALPSIINAVLLTSAWSAGCADLFVSSRTLYGLYCRGHAPKIIGRVRSDGLPWVAVTIGAFFALLSFMAGSKGSAGKAFGYFANMTAICGMISWACILWTYLRWHKGIRMQGIDRRTLAYTAPFQPYLSYCESPRLHMLVWKHRADYPQTAFPSVFWCSSSADSLLSVSAYPYHALTMMLMVLQLAPSTRRLSSLPTSQSRSSSCSSSDTSSGTRPHSTNTWIWISGLGLPQCWLLSPRRRD